MDIAVTIVMMIPVILAVALIINVIRKNLTEREAGDPVNITGVIPAVIVLVVAVMIIGSMGAAISPYSYDEDSGELTINSDVGSGSQDWDSYGTDVKSLVLTSKVKTVADGAFDTLTALEYLEIPDTVESITSSAFGVTLKDYLDQTITEPEAGEYLGTGDGTLYYADGSIYTYTSGNIITGLATDYSAAKILAFPTEYQGEALIAIGISAFDGNANIEKALAPSGSSLRTLNQNIFRNCTALETVELSMVTVVGGNTFLGCTSLESLDLPLMEIVPFNGFFGCTSLTSIDLSSATTITKNAFSGCSAITSFNLPRTTTIGETAFAGCTGVTSVTFGDLTSVHANSFPAWTFYDSDGETQLDKTVASNLAGYTFQGTASALVKVLPDRSALTTEQTLQVQELTKKAALTETKTLLLDETEIPSVEEKELASA